jgi:uncharacterized protein GlcG (DUF336 family)
MSTFTLEQASTIVDRALARGREIHSPPLTVAVLDAGGHLKILKREDGAGILRPDIATGKAWGALGMGFPTRELARRAALMPMFFGALAAMCQGKMVPVPGGVLIRSENGEVLGAVGITGDTSDRDEECAVAGVKAAGLTPDFGETPSTG